MQFILASSSPRRKELLESIGIIPDLIISPDIDESNLKDELPTACAKRLAKNKAVKIKNDYPDSLILTADSIAFCGRRIIDKTDNIEVARNYLKLLSGRRHKVVTSLYVTYNNKSISRTVKTIINFKNLNKHEIEWYLESEEWINVAGAYKIQGKAAGFIKSIKRSLEIDVFFASFATFLKLPKVGIKILTICFTFNILHAL